MIDCFSSFVIVMSKEFESESKRKPFAYICDSLRRKNFQLIDWVPTRHWEKMVITLVWCVRLTINRREMHRMYGRKDVAMRESEKRNITQLRFEPFYRRTTFCHPLIRTNSFYPACKYDRSLTRWCKPCLFRSVLFPSLRWSKLLSDRTSIANDLQGRNQEWSVVHNGIMRDRARERERDEVKQRCMQACPYIETIVKTVSIELKRENDEEKEMCLKKFSFLSFFSIHTHTSPWPILFVLNE